MVPVGTLLNVATVVVGTVLGTLLGNRLPERMRETAVAATGLISLALGLQMGLQTRNILITLGSLVAGGVIGEWWQLDRRLDAFGRWIERRMTGSDGAPAGGPDAGSTGEGAIARGFVTASLIFCVGPVTVLGSIQDGHGDFQLLAIKALLDGVTAIALASSIGWGVGLSAITVLVFQGGISLVSRLVGQGTAALLAGQNVLVTGRAVPLGDAMIAEMTAVGGMVIIGIGLLLLDLKRIRVANFLPSLAVAPCVVFLLYCLGVPIAP